MKEKLSIEVPQEEIERRDTEGWSTTGLVLSKRILEVSTTNDLSKLVEIAKEYPFLGSEMEENEDPQDYLKRYMGIDSDSAIAPARALIKMANEVGANHEDLEFLHSVVISPEDGVNAIENQKTGKLVKQYSKFAYEHKDEYGLTEEDFEDIEKK